MLTFSQKIARLSIFTLFFGVLAILIFKDLIPLLAFPLGLLAIYFALFHADYVFIALFFLAPVSFNIESFTDGFGLYIPTEPLLFGLLLLTIWRSLLNKEFPSYLKNNLIVISFVSYLVVLLFTGIFSSHPVASFKFLLVKLWFFIPIMAIGTRVFENIRNIRLALWLFVFGMTLVMIYTVICHAMYGFGEKEAHWVMSPFFKDHTIYGAMVAFSLFIVVGLYWSKKYDLLTSISIIILILINVIGLYFSYTRAAWLSVVAALGIWFLIHFRVKLVYLVSVCIIALAYLAYNWTDISYSMSKNKMEHTTENFGDRLQSSANVSSDASNLERINRWDCALQMFQKRPLTGFGAGTYAFEYAPFQRAANKTIISTNFGDWGNAHSEYLGALAETGIFGFLTFIFFVSMIFYKGIKLYYRLEEHEVKTLVLAMILALSSYFIHAFLNNYLDSDKAAIPIFGICAMFIALEYKLNQPIKIS